MYRPPKNTPSFAEDFTKLLTTNTSDLGCFAIAGDYNINIDNAATNMAKEIKTDSKTFDLTQHAHGVGHTLDLLISKGLNISSIVKDVALSDQICIFFDILISPAIEARSVSVKRRRLNENTSVTFMKAISLTLVVFSFNS